MDIRDRATARVKNPESEEQKSLLFDYIQPEELHACTTCQACVEACPILINPMDIIVALRQYIAMETDQTPTEWQRMYAQIETNGAPWPFSAQERNNWYRE